MQSVESLLRDEFLWNIIAGLVTAILVSIWSRHYRPLTTFIFAVMKNLYQFVRNQLITHGPRIKSMNWRRIAVWLLALTLIISSVYGCQWVRHRFAENAKAAETEKEAKRQLEAEEERIESEKKRASEEEWEKFSRDLSDNELSYKIVYHSRIWIPCFLFCLLVYILGNASYIFIGIAKGVTLFVFVVSFGFVLARFVPDLAEWKLFTECKDFAADIAKELNAPVDPLVWLGTSIVAGIIIELLARSSRSRGITVNVENKK